MPVTRPPPKESMLKRAESLKTRLWDLADQQHTHTDTHTEIHIMDCVSGCAINMVHTND